jgi:hypothetical protein
MALDVEWIAVGMRITEHPPHRTGRAALSGSSAIHAQGPTPCGAPTGQRRRLDEAPLATAALMSAIRNSRSNKAKMRFAGRRPPAPAILLLALRSNEKATSRTVGCHVQVFDHEVSQTVEVGQVRLGSGDARAAKEHDLALVAGSQQVVGQSRTVAKKRIRAFFNLRCS